MLESRPKSSKSTESKKDATTARGFTWRLRHEGEVCGENRVAGLCKHNALESGINYRRGFKHVTPYPALYLVFPGKEEIFSAVIEWASERSLKAIREGLKNEWALEKKLLYTLELSIGQGYDTIKAHPDAEDLLAFNDKSPAIQAGSAKLQGYLAELLREAVKGLQSGRYL